MLVVWATCAARGAIFHAPDVALLGASGRLGLSGELLFECQQHTLLFATFVQLENRIARGLWAAIAPWHRKIVRDLLEQMIHRELV
jgi:hypothetical protein